jgi:hypothetical protein
VNLACVLQHFDYVTAQRLSFAVVRQHGSANAGTMQIEKFRDSVLQIVVKTAITAAIAAI